MKKSGTLAVFLFVVFGASMGACAKIDRPLVNDVRVTAPLVAKSESLLGSCALPASFPHPRLEHYPQLRGLFLGKTKGAHGFAVLKVKSWAQNILHNGKKSEALLQTNTDMSIRFKPGEYRPDADLKALLEIYKVEEGTSCSDALLSVFYSAFLKKMDRFASLPSDASIFDSEMDWVQQVETLAASPLKERFVILDLRSAAGTDLNRLAWATLQLQKIVSPLVIWTDELTRGTAELFTARARAALPARVLVVGNRTMGYARSFCEIPMPWDASLKMSRGCEDLDDVSAIPVIPTVNLPISKETVSERSRLRLLGIPLSNFRVRAAFPAWLTVSTQETILNESWGSLDLVKQIATEWTSSFAK